MTIATTIPFNKPLLTGREDHYLAKVQENACLAGNGEFSNRCSAWLEQRSGCQRAMMTHSCTAALELAALLLDLQPGDEIIMPSYTFVSTANAFVLRGAIPVFVDIRPDTLNLDEGLVEQAISSRTRAIVPVHYAGVSCEMDALVSIAAAHGLTVIEDAAQAVMSTYRGRTLGTIGDMGCFSFHETKNLTCGEGGAILLNRPELVGPAEIRRDKGTNRSQFLSGKADRYTWHAIGSSFGLNELSAAFLLAQLEAAEAVTAVRRALWDRYQESLGGAEARGLLRRPVVPEDCRHNGHLYYVLLAENVDRRVVLAEMAARGVECHFHYVPLHSSPAGSRFARAAGPLPVTEAVAARLVRLPMWTGLTLAQQCRVVETLEAAIRQGAGAAA